jgi:hypothetical protein
VGREQELRRAGKLLGEARLVTLTGPGRAGKKRRSVEASARLAEQRPVELSDGVWFVPLAPVRDALDVPQAVLAALGIQETAWPADPAEAARLAALSPLDRLTDALTSRRLLPVLDNCEHVAAARLAGQVLAAAPGVRILVTSRRAGPRALTARRGAGGRARGCAPCRGLTPGGRTSPRPESGRSSVDKIRTTVVLPAPFGPSKASTCPRPAAMLTSARAVVAPKLLVRLSRPQSHMSCRQTGRRR